MTGSIQVGNENKSILITHTNKENKISLSSKKLRSWFLKFSRTSSTPNFSLIANHPSSSYYTRCLTPHNPKTDYNRQN